MTMIGRYTRQGRPDIHATRTEIGYVRIDRAAANTLIKILQTQALTAGQDSFDLPAIFLEKTLREAGYKPDWRPDIQPEREASAA